jgi:hypothetical protein
MMCGPTFFEKRSWVGGEILSIFGAESSFSEVHLARHRGPGVKWTTPPETLTRHAVACNLFGDSAHGWVRAQMMPILRQNCSRVSFWRNCFPANCLTGGCV